MREVRWILSADAGLVSWALFWGLGYGLMSFPIAAIVAVLVFHVIGWLYEVFSTGSQRRWR